MPISPHCSEQVTYHGVLHEPVPSSEPAHASQVLPVPLSSPISSPSPRTLPPPTLPGSPSLSPSSSSTLSNSSSPSTSSGSPNPPLAPTHPLRTHPMVTRAQNNIFKPKQLFHTTPTLATTSLKPTCVSQALKEPVWRQAMSEEFTALVRQGTWELVPPTPDQHLIGCKWVFRVKRGKDGSIEHYKARLVAKGFHQRPGFDYFNTFSPVIKPTTIRTILSLADSTRLYFLVYVDDILLIGNDSGLLRSLVHKMGQCFSLKDLGPLTFFLGIEVIQTHARLLLSQHKYILDILCRANMDDAKPVSTPLPSSANLSSLAGSALSNGSEYRRILGSLQYLTLTWPDISFAPSLSLHAYSDSDWVGDRDSSISTTGYVVFLGSNPISWRASKQRAVARSSTEAKYRALAATTSKLIWVRNLLSELGVFHIAIDLHFVRDLVDRGFLHVSHISTRDQFADGFTKPLSSARFCLLRSKLGIVDSSSVLRGRYQINPSSSQKETKSHHIYHSTSQQKETKSP
ncbi:hypothetical protein SLEP1_g12725 [Rubroshorea leprosula]|uniref:Reverse transcriptase Ty1/copia-type domain-containing protein n=1 Tax=Rubroshorea leprosula TaxID=152421 RepID=A0AAV5IML4_9ROSI|nr:hypothetical protein SLEP1_g12725 [Rubroshorea leprosula]